MTQEIEIKNVRNVKHLRVVPEPGLTTLCGENGQGKSNALQAIKALIDGEGNLQPHDDADVGFVSGFGGLLRVGSRTTRSGELEITTIAGKDLAIFVNPEIENPESADTERAKAVCRLGRIKAELAPFEELLGGPEKLREIAKPESLGLKSLPEMAAAIKRDVEAVARKMESEAKNEAGRAAGLREGLSDVDLKAPSDEAELSSEAQSAVRAVASLEATEAAARNAKRSGDAARKILEDAGSVPDPEECQARIREAESLAEVARLRIDVAQEPDAAYLKDLREKTTHAAAKVEEVRERVDQARRALAEAETVLAQAKGEHELAIRDLDSTRSAELQAARGDLREAQGKLSAATEASAAAVRAKDARAAAEEAVRRASESRDPDEILAELGSTRQKVVDAQKAQENGAVVRALLKRAEEAKASSARAEELRKQAEQVRETAGACEDVVTKAIRARAPRGMAMKKGRMIVQTERGETLVGELSKGERTTLGLDVEIDALLLAHEEARAREAQDPDPETIVQRVPVLIIAQELYEGLSPRARAAVDQKLVERGVIGITAQATDGELRAERFSPREPRP